jgi:hypothetical protein
MLDDDQSGGSYKNGRERKMLKALLISRFSNHLATFAQDAGAFAELAKSGNESAGY